MPIRPNFVDVTLNTCLNSYLVTTDAQIFQFCLVFINKSNDYCSACRSSNGQNKIICTQQLNAHHNGHVRCDSEQQRLVVYKEEKNPRRQNRNLSLSPISHS